MFRKKLLQALQHSNSNKLQKEWQRLMKQRKDQQHQK